MTISIIVPIYKVENELTRCVDSLINQTYKDIEIILVDDGSPDKCPDICDDFARRDTRVQVIHKENGGLSDARNCGLLHANGEYVLYVDSDDYIDLESCYRFVELAKKYSPDVVVGNALEINGSSKKRLNHSTLKESVCYSAREYILKSVYAGEWYAPAWLNLYRRQFLLDHNLFYQKGILHEDMEILPRLFLNASSVVYLDFDFYYYIVRESSIMGTALKNKNVPFLIKIFTDWKEQFDQVQDKKLRNGLYGALIKHYLHTCRTYQLEKSITMPGITSLFILRFSLNLRERIKAVIFLMSRKLYYRL